MSASRSLSHRANALTRITIDNSELNPPRATPPEIADMTTLLNQATHILEKVRNQAEFLRRRAYTDGQAAGFAKAQAEAARYLVEAQKEAQKFVSASEAHVVWLAVSILERIAPLLDEAKLVAALAVEATRAIRGAQHLRIYVHGGAVQATRAMLAQQQHEDPTMDFSVLVDPKLQPFDCVVESELGRIEVGLSARLNAVRDELSSSAAKTRS
jgi:flagellar biosynthesis/type III secretory pathway protein FliH